MKGPKNGIVKASFSFCPTNDRKKFPQSHAMLLVSVGQPYHENEKLLATIKLVNRSFSKCTVVVADTLQRYNLLPEVTSAEEAYKLSKNHGDAWLKRNQFSLSQLTIPHNFIRWDEWLAHPDYKTQSNCIDKLLESNPLFKEAIIDSIGEYLERIQKRDKGQIIDCTAIYTNCLEYLKEECAVMCLWPEAGYHFEVYPRKRNAAMATIYDLLIKPLHPNLLISVNLRFKRYSQQHSEVDDIINEQDEMLETH